MRYFSYIFARKNYTVISKSYVALEIVRNDVVGESQTLSQLKLMVPYCSSGNGSFAICSDTTR